jgi:hypothetical protein
VCQLKNEDFNPIFNFPLGFRKISRTKFPPALGNRFISPFPQILEQNVSPLVFFFVRSLSSRLDRSTVATPPLSSPLLTGLFPHGRSPRALPSIVPARSPGSLLPVVSSSSSLSRSQRTSEAPEVRGPRRAAVRWDARRSRLPQSPPHPSLPPPWTPAPAKPPPPTARYAEPCGLLRFSAPRPLLRFHSPFRRDAALAGVVVRSPLF